MYYHSNTLFTKAPVNGRFEEDDEAWLERRRQKKEELDIAIQRAKERKEEEEKRFNEQQQAATLKLKKLEATIEAGVSILWNYEQETFENVNYFRTRFF